MYLAFLRGDIVIMRYEMTKWDVQEELEMKNEQSNEESKQTFLDLVNLHVKERIDNTGNFYLMYYLRRYWNDYDQYQYSLTQIRGKSSESSELVLSN